MTAHSFHRDDATFAPVAASDLAGTTTNDNATAGNIGEYISSNVPIGSEVTLANGVIANVTSISLTAGDWDVSGNAVSDVDVSTIITYFSSAISPNSAALPTLPGGGAAATWNGSSTGVNVALPSGTVRVSLSGATTYYLVTQALFSVSSAKAYGFIGARRMR